MCVAQIRALITNYMLEMLIKHIHAHQTKRNTYYIIIISYTCFFSRQRKYLPKTLSFLFFSLFKEYTMYIKLLWVIVQQNDIENNIQHVCARSI